MAREMCEVREARSSMAEVMVETDASPRRRGAFPSRRERSWTRLENDILAIVPQGFRFDRAWRGCAFDQGKSIVGNPDGRIRHVGTELSHRDWLGRCRLVRFILSRLMCVPTADVRRTTRRSAGYFGVRAYSPSGVKSVRGVSDMSLPLLGLGIRRGPSIPFWTDLAAIRQLKHWDF